MWATALELLLISQRCTARIGSTVAVWISAPRRSWRKILNSTSIMWLMTNSHFRPGGVQNTLSFNMFNVLTNIYPHLTTVFSFNVAQLGCDKNEETTGSLNLIKSRKAKKCAQMFEENIAGDVVCSHQASNYKIHVTLSLFSGSSGRVSVPCPRVCMAETSNIPILFGHGQNFPLTHTWAQCMRRLGQIASVILLSVVFFSSKSTTERSLYSKVCNIYIEYIKMQKK